MLYLSNQKLKPTDLKKLTFLLIASFVFTSADAQFFKRKESFGDNKPKREVKQDSRNNEEMKAKAKAEKEEKKSAKEAEKAAKQAEKKEDKAVKESKDFTPKKLSEKEKLAPPLEGVKWALLDINGKPLTDNTGTTPYIIMFSKGSKLEGHTGCNIIAGSYKAGRHDDLTFQPVTTKMACSDMKTESMMNEALGRSNIYMLNGQNLLLYHDNMLMAIFEARFEE